ncbi:YceI family protein [Phycicoccus endophyticus]|uniref:YceI family protein n=1 Tax=Phycicoccus endophyticus TaxID=1690220 RepID=A0A7G9R0V8_9MICO|nr:YceI family protein [Phycicoccus endophyticus]NHI19523.1 YceI family protein [Phycicoccus endophyticus]QNN49233.1 YceI family protein [Phycicoccus endophyticus]GGL39887.1 polyisoprenoid-binding protein [Phycicoccus endophyticus]
MRERPSLSGDWAIDPQHTRIGFSARHAMITTVRGSFNDVAGRIHADLEDVDASHVEVTLRAASIDTRTPQRDEHLRSADFLDVEHHPLVTFVSSRVEEIEDDAFLVTGDLTIRDVTRTMSIPIALTGVRTDAFGVLRAGFEGSRKVDRRDFGLEWNMPLDAGGVLVSERVTLEFEISATRAQGELAR